MEYMDFECPSCANAALMLQRYYEKFPDDIYVELRYFPLSGHRHAMAAARVAECSREQGYYWEVVNPIMKTQKEWKDMAETRPVFMKIAADAGVDLEALEACYKTPEVAERIFQERWEAKKMGLQATPTFYVNEEMIVGFKAMKEKMAELFGELEPLPGEEMADEEAHRSAPAAAPQKAAQP